MRQIKTMKKYCNGKLVSFRKYDKNRNNIYYKNLVTPEEEIYEYDENNNLIHTHGIELDTGDTIFEEWWTYDIIGHLYRYNHSDGIEEYFTYDNDGNEVYWENNYNQARISTYVDGLLMCVSIVYFDYDDDYCYKSDTSFYQYDENRNLIHSYNTHTFKEWYEYDEKGRKIHFRNSYGYEEWWKYDDENLIIYHKDTGSDIEEWNEYDNEGILIRTKMKMCGSTSLYTYRYTYYED